MRGLLALIAVSSLAVACKEKPRAEPTPSGPSAALTATRAAGLQQILARQPKTQRAGISHVQIGWKEIASADGGVADPRALQRTQADAARLAMEIFTRAKAGEPIDKLMEQYSEDPWKVKVYEASGQTNLARPLVDLGQRLEVGEVGLTQTGLGYHVVKRVE
jgi:hypothetical protein